MAVIGCGIIAVLYGVVTASRVMAADAGTPKMQEIAQAIQEGAGAYLRRQYTTIAIVGVVVLIILASRNVVPIGRNDDRKLRYDAVQQDQRAHGSKHLGRAPPRIGTALKRGFRGTAAELRGAIYHL